MTNYLKQYIKTVKPRYREAYGDKFIICTTDNDVKFMTRRYLEQNYKGRYIIMIDGKQTSFIVES